MHRFILTALTAGMLLGCTEKTPDTSLANWEDWKQQTEDGYVRDDLAVLKAANYQYISDGESACLIKAGDNFALRHGSASGCVEELTFSGGKLISVSDDEERVYSELPKTPRALSDRQRLRFNLENITHREQRVRAILFDDNAKALKGFPGLSFFDHDAAGIVTAKFEADPDFPEVILDTERGLTKAFYRAGYANFSIGDKPYKMPLYTGSNKPEKIDYFFTGFVDATTGSSSYGTGRYVNISDFGVFPPETFEIDFNYAYNPYCARSEAYNCPVIDFAITAPIRYGESYAEKE